MRLTAVPFLLAGLSSAIPFEASDDVALIESRAGGPAIDPHLYIVGKPYTSGTGCPKGTAEVEFDKDAQTITVSYSAFQVATGPAPLTAEKSAQSCKLVVNVKYDQGVTYGQPVLRNAALANTASSPRLSVFNTEFNGYASLRKGVSGRVIGTASFTGGTGKPRWDLGLSGPFVNTFTLTGDPKLRATSACGTRSATLNIDITMLLSPTAPTDTNALSGTMGVSIGSPCLGSRSR